MADIRDLFQEGAADKVCKISPAEIRELSFSKYPSRYDIPIEYHITTSVSKMHFSVTASKRSGGSGDHLEVSKQRRGVLPRFVVELIRLVAERPAIMHILCRALLLEGLHLHECVLLPDFPEDTAIHSKVSALKASPRRSW